jgi:3-oxoacyl-[acyl-carrier-protein] synthase III
LKWQSGFPKNSSDLGVDREEIDMVVLVTENRITGYPPRRASCSTASASEIVIAFDITMGCSGYIYAS